MKAEYQIIDRLSNTAVDDGRILPTLREAQDCLDCFVWSMIREEREWQDIDGRTDEEVEAEAKSHYYIQKV